MYYSKSGWGDRHLIKDEILANGGDKNNIFAWGDSQYYHVAIPIPYVYGNIALRDEVLPQRLQYETHRGYLKGTKPEKKLTNLIDELAENLPDYIAIEYAPEKTANDSLEVSELFLIFANYYELTLATYGNLLLYKRDTKNNFRFLSGSLIFSPSVLTTLFNIENITENGLYHTITVTPRVTSSKKNYEVRVSKPTSFEYISNLSNKMKSDYCTYQSYATNFKQGIIGLECARDDIIYISSAIGHDEWHSKENGHTKILDYYINDKQVDIDYRESINKPKKLRVFFSNGEVWAYNFDGDY